MFDLDKWQEIFLSLRKHKLRTFLTGFGVAWGIFVLIILLGSGQGLHNGILTNFSGYASNAIWVSGRITSLPYKGLPDGRRIRPSIRDLELMKKNIPGIQYLSPQVQLVSSGLITYKEKEGSFSVQGIYADYFKIELLDAKLGRLLNQLDDKEKRKVAVIGKKAHEILFEEKNPEGEYIKIKNEHFKIVGVFDKVSKMRGRDEASIFIPYSSLIQTFNQNDAVSQFCLTPGKEIAASIIETKIRGFLASRCEFDVKDKRALWISNLEEQFKVFNALFSGIAIFLWIIGISTLVGGVVGVGNIMLVTVKERTKEIGLRKSLGATPNSIIALVLQEAIVITTIAGYTGMIFGILILKLSAMLVNNMGDEGQAFTFFKNPEIDIKIALLATFVLIIAGAIAGFIPARKAAKIRPIEALRYE